MSADDELAYRDEPCRTCPYRCDVPAGLWHPDEYRKLVAYDTDTWAQPPAVFLCHHTGTDDPTVCRGWLAVGGWELLGVRLAVTAGRLDPDQVDQAIATDVFATGNDAAAWGMSGVTNPGPDAAAAIGRLERSIERRTNPAAAGRQADDDTVAS